MPRARREETLRRILRSARQGAMRGTTMGEKKKPLTNHEKRRFRKKMTI